MGIYEGMLPKEQMKGKRGFYPVATKEEWDSLPAVYKAMEWFPQDVFDDYRRRNVRSIPEYVEFSVTYLTPYKINATVKVHVQEVQKILFCLFEDAQCQLFSVSGVVFQNGVRWGAQWKQDTRTGAFAIYASGHCVGMQGGYLGHIPANIEKEEDGTFKWAGFRETDTRCHYELGNPFR